MRELRDAYEYSRSLSLTKKRILNFRRGNKTIVFRLINDHAADPTHYSYTLKITQVQTVTSTGALFVTFPLTATIAKKYTYNRKIKQTRRHVASIKPLLIHKTRYYPFSLQDQLSLFTIRLFHNFTDFAMGRMGLSIDFTK